MYIFKNYLLSLLYFSLKFGLKILISAVTAKCWKLQKAGFGPPPLYLKKDRCNLSCSFSLLLILSIYGSFVDPTYKDH